MVVSIFRNERSLSCHDLDGWRPVPTTIAVDAVPDASVLDDAIRPVGPQGAWRLFGPAVTVYCPPPDLGAVAHVLEMIQSGDVLVIAADGDCSAALMGGIFGGYLRDKGCAGIVCDGAVRDTALLGSWPHLPVYARGVTPRGPTSVERGTINQIIRIGSAVIGPGDLVMGDGDGIVVLSPAMVLGGLAGARAKMQAETRFMNALASGRRPKDVLNLPMLTDADAHPRRRS